MRTLDLLTASQALSQLSYAPVRRSTIRELGRRCKDNFGNICGALNGSGAKETHDARHSPRGEPRGRRQARRLPLQARHVAPDAAGQTKAIRGASVGMSFRTPSGQFTEPCVARPSWSLHKQTGLLRRFPDFRPHAYFRKTGRQSTCGFTSGEISVFSHPQSNVVNRHGFKMALNY